MTHSAPRPPSPSANLEAYLQEYYGELSVENEQIGTFLAAATQPPIARPARSLDVGCGPTLLYWGLFVDGYDEARGFDASAEDVAFVRAEVAAGVQGAMHERYAAVCALRDARGAADPDRFQALCRRVREVETGDAAATWPHADGSAELVTMIFSLEVLPDHQRAQAALREALRVLSPGGRLVLATLGEATSWRVGDYIGRCLYFTAGSLADDLAAAGFVDVDVRRVAASTAVERDQGYTWMLFSTARRAPVATAP